MVLLLQQALWKASPACKSYTINICNQIKIICYIAREYFLMYITSWSQLRPPLTPPKLSRMLWLKEKERTFCKMSQRSVFRNLLDLLLDNAQWSSVKIINHPTKCQLYKLHPPRYNNNELRFSYFCCHRITAQGAVCPLSRYKWIGSQELVRYRRYTHEICMKSGTPRT